MLGERSRSFTTDFFFLNNIWVLASRAAMHDEAAVFFYWPPQLNTHHSDSFTASSPAAEFLFLLWAVYLCYAVRTVPSAFHEPRYMAIAVHNELILSAIFYVIRYCSYCVESVNLWLEARLHSTASVLCDKMQERKKEC